MQRAAGILLAALVLLACGREEAEPPHQTVLCENRTIGFSQEFAGPFAVSDCLHHTAMASEGDDRRAFMRPGAYTFRPGERFELDSGWTLEGTSPRESVIVAARDNDLFRAPFHSLIFVRGAGVTLRNFRYDGNCWVSPEIARACEEKLLAWYGIVVACSFGRERGEDCDVDGLLIDRVRVINTKYPFFASASAGNTPAGPGLFTNFLDFTWTFRNFQVGSTDRKYGPATVFGLGHKTAPDGSRSPYGLGPGEGVAPADGRRHYVVNIEDTRIETRLVFGAAFREGEFVAEYRGEGMGARNALIDAHVDDADVDLVINLRDSTLVASHRLISAGTRISKDRESIGGSVTLNCRDSTLAVDHSLWAERSAALPDCPPFDAAIYLDQPAAGRYAAPTRLNLDGCTVEVRNSVCPAPAAIDTGILGNSLVCIGPGSPEPTLRGAGRTLRPAAGESCAETGQGDRASRGEDLERQ